MHPKALFTMQHTHKMSSTQTALYHSTCVSALLLRTALALLLACSFTGGILTLGVLSPQTAFAETTEIYDEPDTFQQEVEATADAYNEALQRVDSLELQISDNEALIREIEKELPLQQETAAGALRSLYIMQRESASFIDIILGSQSLTDFITNVEYVSYVYNENQNELISLEAMQEELKTTQAELSLAKDEAVIEEAAAADALTAAQEAREEAQRLAEEKAAREAEEAAAALAAEQARIEAEAQAQEQEAAESEVSSSESTDTSTEGTGGSSGGTVAPPSSDGADWSVDKSAFVAEWAPRIDSYLAGSALSGQGSTFAEAAWDYGVDPRWSPAISHVESTKGAYCYYPHNAWGWGGITWGSWEEAINAHVRGLANGYGYTISIEAAQKYCPPTWEHWYSSVSAQMNMI